MFPATIFSALAGLTELELTLCQSVNISVDSFIEAVMTIIKAREGPLDKKGHKVLRRFD